MAAAAPRAWRRRGVLRAISILAVSAIIAAVASSFDVIRDFGSFHASLLTGSPGGAYYILGSQLAERAKRDRSRLDIVATAGSLENVSRLIADRGRCVEQFAFVQDGTPVQPGSGLELLGRLPEPESLLLLGRNNRPPVSFADLRRFHWNRPRGIGHSVPCAPPSRRRRSGGTEHSDFLSRARRAGATRRPRLPRSCRLRYAGGR